MRNQKQQAADTPEGAPKKKAIVQRHDPVAARKAREALAKEPRILVKALEKGYYDDQERYIDDVFPVAESQFSERWMEKVDKKAASELQRSSRNVNRDDMSDEDRAKRIEQLDEAVLGTENRSSNKGEVEVRKDSQSFTPDESRSALPNARAPEKTAKHEDDARKKGGRNA